MEKKLKIERGFAALFKNLRVIGLNVINVLERLSFPAVFFYMKLFARISV
jgi:hypothetical protein